MQKNPADRCSRAGTQGAPYTASELALIEELAPGAVTRAQLQALFPQRSPGAVKKKIVEARHRLGLVSEKAPPRCAQTTTNALDPDDPGEDDGWFAWHQHRMASGNAAFLDALKAA